MPAETTIRRLRSETTAAVEPEEAVNVVVSDLGDANLEVLQGPELAIFVDRLSDKPSYHLAYRLRTNQHELIGIYEYIIDAQNGSILRKVNLVNDAVEGTGNVYQTNPLHGTPITVTLHRLLDLSPRRLDGEHIVVHDHYGDDAESSTATFEYGTDDHRFDQVMAYSHSDDLEEWLQYVTGGFPGILGENQVAKVTAWTRSTFCYACTIPSQNEAYYSDGTAYSGLRNPTWESAVVGHEYMHIVSETYNTLTQQDSARAMDEGYSDYFGVGYRHDVGGISSTVIGEYIDEPGGTKFNRDVNNTAQLNDFGTDIDGSGTVSAHDGGMILGGALWDFTENAYLPTAIKITLGSLSHLDNDPGFYDAREAMIAAALEQAEEPEVPKIDDAFAAHGIGYPSGAAKAGFTSREMSEPMAFRLFPNYPNPFNPSTDIRFDLPKAMHVRLRIYDMLGREVERLVDEHMDAGTQHVTWNAVNMPSGTYVYRLDVEFLSRARRMVLLK